MSRNRTILCVAAIVSLILSSEARAVIWGIRSTAVTPPPRPSVGPVELFSINEDGTGYVDHGNIFNNSPGVNLYTDFDGLAFSPGYGLVAFEYFGSRSGSRLSIIDPDGDGTHDVTATKVDDYLFDREIRGAVFDRQQRLWALDARHEEILRVDLLDGSMKPGSNVGLTLGGSPYDVSDAADLAVREDGSFFLTSVDADDNRAKVYSLDETTGALSLVHANTAWLGEVGATFSRSAGANDLFAVDVQSDEDFVRYDLSGSVTRTALFTLPATMNAGRGDLAAEIVIPEPSTLAIFGLGGLTLLFLRRFGPRRR